MDLKIGDDRRGNKVEITVMKMKTIKKRVDLRSDLSNNHGSIYMYLSYHMHEHIYVYIQIREGGGERERGSDGLIY